MLFRVGSLWFRRLFHPGGGFTIPSPAGLLVWVLWGCRVLDYGSNRLHRIIWGLSCFWHLTLLAVGMLAAAMTAGLAVLAAPVAALVIPDREHFDADSKELWIFSASGVGTRLGSMG